jgi:hypothetical protein
MSMLNVILVVAVVIIGGLYMMKRNSRLKTED